ncbi:hypothetical protein [Novosphingobium olei]|uniref:hypothetical protein n=1 Tax=Novosphingobium olei TaxID=2728851 RepID=UPI00308CFB60|nr:hypothetical protein NSDW_32940 [Novosphingobium olei]
MSEPEEIDWDDLLGGALEAGLSLPEFWSATWRQIHLARRAYHRRRGWLAWHIARLGHADPKSFPDLEDMTGEARPDRSAARISSMFHTIRIMKAARAARQKG